MVGRRKCEFGKFLSTEKHLYYVRQISVHWCVQMSSTFSIRLPKKLREEMKKYSEVDWADEIRKCIKEKINKLKLEEVLTKARTLREKMMKEVNHAELIREDREK